MNKSETKLDIYLKTSFEKKLAEALAELKKMQYLSTADPLPVTFSAEIRAYGYDMDEKVEMSRSTLEETIAAVEQRWLIETHGQLVRSEDGRTWSYHVRAHLPASMSIPIPIEIWKEYSCINTSEGKWLYTKLTSKK